MLVSEVFQFQTVQNLASLWFLQWFPKSMVLAFLETFSSLLASLLYRSDVCAFFVPSGIYFFSEVEYSQRFLIKIDWLSLLESVLVSKLVKTWKKSCTTKRAPLDLTFSAVLQIQLFNNSTRSITNYASNNFYWRLSDNIRICNYRDYHISTFCSLIYSAQVSWRGATKIWPSFSANGRPFSGEIAECRCRIFIFEIKILFRRETKNSLLVFLFLLFSWFLDCFNRLVWRVQILLWNSSAPLKIIYESTFKEIFTF